MKLLYSNDRLGEHAPSWYHDNCKVDTRASLSVHEDTQVCVIGAGFTGLSAALQLTDSGIDCVVLDAHRVGWGASGRNGGQLGSGFNMNQTQLETMLGREHAKALWQAAEHAKHWIMETSRVHQFDLDYRPGIVYAQHRPGSHAAEHEYCEHMAKHYGYEGMHALDKHSVRERVLSDDYCSGILDSGAGHIQPLKLATGLARAAEQQGARIFECSEALRITRKSNSSHQRVITAMGSVTCDNVVVAVNGYVDGLDKAINRRQMPINNFIIVTEPLGERASDLLPHDDAVADSRFVVNYFRRVGGDRLLFGGGENYSYRFPVDITPQVRRAMLEIFPDLHDTAIDYAWGGTLAITRNRLPFIGDVSAGRYTAGGYSGHGVALACLYGKALAEHLAGRSELYQTLKVLPNKPFPGGSRVRPALLALAMTGYSWLDRL